MERVSASCDDRVSMCVSWSSSFRGVGPAYHCSLLQMSMEESLVSLTGEGWIGLGGGAYIVGHVTIVSRSQTLIPTGKGLVHCKS